jgi:hypothetical protein
MSGRIVSDIIEFKDALDSFLDENEMHLLILRGEKKNHIALVKKHVSWYLCRQLK